MNVLEMANVKKKFGKFTALDGVNLEVKSGEINGFIGPNGKCTYRRIYEE